MPLADLGEFGVAAEKAVDEGAGSLPCSRVNDHSSRLVDHDHIGILVDHRERDVSVRRQTLVDR